MITLFDKSILLSIIFIAIIIDLWKQRIPNVLIQIGLLVGIIGIFFNITTISTFEKIAAFVLGVCILFIPFALGAIGAGDVKLLGLIGFYTGIRGIINISLISFVIGGIVSVLFILLYRLKTYKNLNIVTFSFINMCATKKLLMDDERKLKIPYAIPLGIGTVCVLIFNWGVL